jgi:hypothetical protein
LKLDAERRPTLPHETYTRSESTSLLQEFASEHGSAFARNALEGAIVSDITVTRESSGDHAILRCAVLHPVANDIPAEG